MIDRDRIIAAVTSDRFLDALFLFLTFCLAFLLAFNVISEPDTFWHLKLGQYMLRTRTFPYTDMFSYTLAGTRVFPVEWLFEVVWALLYSSAGVAGLILAKAAIAGLTAVLLYRTAVSAKINRFISFAVVGSISMTVGFYFTDRPQLITYLFLALFVYVASLDDNENRWAVWLLPGIMLVWFNMHPGAVFGLLFLAGWTLEGFAGTLKRKIPTKRFLVRLAVFLLACSMSFLTPSSYHLYLFLFHHVQSLETKSGLEYIHEFRAPGSLTLIISLAVWTLILAAGITKIPFRYVFFGLVMIPLSYSMERMMIMAFIGTAFGIAAIVGSFVRRMHEHKVFSRSLYAAAVLLPLLFVVYRYKTDIMGYKSIGIYRPIYPDKAIHFILDHTIHGNIYNDINFGGALIYLGYPEIHDFIDTRLAPEEKLLADVITAQRSPAAFRELLDRHHVTYALVSTADPIDYSVLLPWPQWSLVYLDDYAEVFVKRGAGNDALIQECDFHLFNLHSFLYTFQPFLYPRAYFTRPGLLDELHRLVQVSPSSGLVHLAYGISIIYSNTDPAGGMEQIDTAYRLQPYYPIVVLWYGILHGMQGNVSLMNRSFDTVDAVLSQEKNTVIAVAMVHYIMGYYYHATGQDRLAVNSLKTAMKLDPRLTMARALLDQIK